LAVRIVRTVPIGLIVATTFLSTSIDLVGGDLVGAGVLVGGGIQAGVGTRVVRGITGLGIGTGEIIGGTGRRLFSLAGDLARGPLAGNSSILTSCRRRRLHLITPSPLS
jgi:hypothetical protein